MFQELLQSVARALDERRIPYMVIGGQAVLVHGEPRLTRDIDITLGVDLDRLGDALDVAAAARLSPLVDPEDFTRSTMVLPCQHADSGIRVDFIFSFSPYEHAAIARSVVIRLGDANVRFASAEDLVVHKIVAGRPRDIEDARTVLVKNPTIDRGLIRSSLSELQNAVERPLIEAFDDLQRHVEP